jgi:hypothetical protein
MVTTDIPLAALIAKVNPTSCPQIDGRLTSRAG